MNAYDNFQNGFSILCNEYFSDIPFSNIYCIVSGVRRDAKSLKKPS